MSKKAYEDIGQDFTEKYGTTMGQLFGKPCLKTDKKAFVAFFKDEMVFKIGKQEVDLLKEKYTGSVNWDPSGKNRAMKDWMQVPVEYIDDWEVLAEQALKFVEENK